jgi:hypothetical protein
MKFHTHTKEQVKLYVVLYILIFTSFDRRHEDNNSELNGYKISQNLIFFYFFFLRVG